jgi:hypothetical protein
MKSKNTAPTIYTWAQSKLAAERLAIWAYAELLNPQSPLPKSYPLRGASTPLLRDGSWGLVLPESKKTRRPKQISEAKKVGRQLNEIAGALRKSTKFLKSYYSPGFVAGDLSKAVSKAIQLLVELAGTQSQRAVELLYFNTVEAVIELEKLSFREDALPLLQAVACKQVLWPVVYPRSRAEQRELKKSMDRLGIGTQSFEKVSSPSRKDQATSGKFAHRIGRMLWEIHFDGNLRQCLWRRAVTKSATAQDRKLAASKFWRHAAENLIVRTQDADSPQKWEKRLVAQGWPRWVVRLHQLPELTNACADDWFDVGWEALNEAASGDVTLIPELALLGKSNAAYGRSRATTKRGEHGKQKSRMESQIESLLRKAFIRRFGNTPNFQTNRDLKNP